MVGAEMTKSAGTQHGGIVLYLALFFDKFLVMISESETKTKSSYLAVAKMCSYLGDHRTDSTSAL